MAFPLTGLVSYWKLDEASGTRMDSHGTNHLTPTQGATGSTTGKIGLAANHGGGDWLRCDSNPTLQMGGIDYTWALWVKPLGGIPCYFMDKGAEFQLLADPFYKAFIPSASGYVESTVQASSGTWAFVVAWREHTTGKWSIQVNNGVVSSSGSFGVPLVNTAPLTVGAIDGTAFFIGAVDEIGFWKRVLTAQERTDLYNGGAGLSYSSTPPVIPVYDPIVAREQIPYKARTPILAGRVYATPSILVTITEGTGIEVGSSFTGPFAAYVPGTKIYRAYVRPTGNTMITLTKRPWQEQVDYYRP